MTQRYKITVEYDGTDLLGWQKQADGASAQEFLEKAIEAFCQEKAEVYGAGRTDAGVHALAQVAHFDLSREVDPFRLSEAANAHLRDMGAPVAVLKAEKAPADFHARYSAVGRAYIYKITNRRAPLVLEKNRSWGVPVTLDVAKMLEAAKVLVGHHDFTSFRAVKCQAKSPVKTLDRLDIRREGENIIFETQARSFLHHQVRNMVGTLKLVGDGHLTADDVKNILEAKDRRAAGPTAPACGLYLSKIMYA